jgi:hypothetical protein
MKTKVKQVTRRETPYLSEQDPAQFIHSNQTHRSASEAFRDADYATPIWRCETDWDRSKEQLAWIGMWVLLLSALYLLATWFNEVMA